MVVIAAEPTVDFAFRVYKHLIIYSVISNWNYGVFHLTSGKNDMINDLFNQKFITLFVICELQIAFSLYGVCFRKEMYEKGDIR